MKGTSLTTTVEHVSTNYWIYTSSIVYMQRANAYFQGNEARLGS